MSSIVPKLGGAPAPEYASKVEAKAEAPKVSDIEDDNLGLPF